jgi:hypothetical protein
MELDQREERIGRLLGESFEHDGGCMHMGALGRKCRSCDLPSSRLKPGSRAAKSDLEA